MSLPEIKPVNYVKAILPGIVTIFLISAGAVNYQTYGLSSFVPLFSVISVYFWGIYRPGAMPNWLVFLIGLYQDILYSTPIGLSSFLLLIFWLIITSQRRFITREIFMVIWIMFFISAMTYMSFYWVMASVYVGKFQYDYKPLVQFAFTILIYPCMHLIFGVINNLGD